MSTVCRLVPKTLRSSLCSQDFWLVVKIEGGFDRIKLEKKSQSSEKAPVLKTRNAISGIRNIRFGGNPVWVLSLYQIYVKSGIRYIRFALIPVCVKSGLHRKIQRGTLLYH